MVVVKILKLVVYEAGEDKFRPSAVVTPRSAKDGSWTKLKSGKNYSSRKEAEADLSRFAQSLDPKWRQEEQIISHEPFPSGSSTTPAPPSGKGKSRMIPLTGRKRNATDLQALKRVKRVLRWPKLTLKDWETLPELRDKRKVQDIPEAVVTALDHLFSGISYKKRLGISHYNHLCYLHSQIKVVEERGATYLTSAASLADLVMKRQAFTFLVPKVGECGAEQKNDESANEELNDLRTICSKSDHDNSTSSNNSCAKNYNAGQRREEETTKFETMKTQIPKTKSKRARQNTFSEAQLGRVGLQASAVAEFCELLGKESAYTAASLRDEAKAIMAVVKELPYDREDKTATTEITRIRKEFTSRRQAVKAAKPDLAQEVIKQPRYAMLKLSSRALGDWLKEYLETGTFQEDGRGKWARVS